MRMKFAIGLALYAAWASGWAVAEPAKRHSRFSMEGLWAANFVMPMEASPKGEALVVPDAEAKAAGKAQAQVVKNMFGPLDPEVPYLMDGVDGLPLVRGQRRSRLVVQPVDGRLPYTAAVRKNWDSPPRPSPSAYDNPEQRPNAERCIVGVGEAPIAALAFASNLQIVKTREAVVIHTEYGDDVRVVPITGRHQPRVLWGNLGDSIGRWEGETLVIETVGLPDGDKIRLAPGLTVTGEATVIERFTAVSDRELLYQFTVIDPKTYTGPWLAEFSWYRTDKPIYEHACHEGNYSLPNILAGARYQEAAARAAAAAAH